MTGQTTIGCYSVNARTARPWRAKKRLVHSICTLKFSRAWSSEFGGDRNCPLSFVLAESKTTAHHRLAANRILKENLGASRSLVSVEHMGWTTEPGYSSDRILLQANWTGIYSGVLCHVRIHQYLGSLFRQGLVSVNFLPAIGRSNGLTVRLVPGVPSDCLPKFKRFSTIRSKLSIVGDSTQIVRHTMGECSLHSIWMNCVYSVQNRPGFIPYSRHYILYGVIRVFDAHF